MEAKEIVTIEVARQKEFGYEPSWEDFVIAGQQAGIREGRKETWDTAITAAIQGAREEVVEFIDKFELIDESCRDEWQAQKKMWGINKEEVNEEEI